jgi:hypothetical protein
LQPQRWEQSLTDLNHPLSADSLIPMFEGMVDRALLKTQAPALAQADARAAAAAASSHGVPAPATHLNMETGSKIQDQLGREK